MAGHGGCRNHLSGNSYPFLAETTSRKTQTMHEPSTDDLQRALEHEFSQMRAPHPDDINKDDIPQIRYIHDGYAVNITVEGDGDTTASICVLHRCNEFDEDCEQCAADDCEDHCCEDCEESEEYSVSSMCDTGSIEDRMRTAAAEAINEMTAWMRKNPQFNRVVGTRRGPPVTARAAVAIARDGGRWPSQV